MTFSCTFNHKLINGIPGPEGEMEPYGLYDKWNDILTPFILR